MGWATYLTTCINFNRKTYNHKSEVEEDLEEAKRQVDKAKENLTRLAFMTEPYKFCDKNERPDSFIKEELEYSFEMYESALIDEYKLSILIRDWDKCHTEEGLAIECPYDSDENVYLEGDFIYTDKHPTQENIFGYELDKEGNIVDDSNAIVDLDGKFKPIEPIDLDSTVEQLLKEADNE